MWTRTIVYKKIVLNATMYKLKLSVLTFLYIISLIRVECLFNGDSCIRIKKSGICMPLEECKPLREEIDDAGHPMPSYLSKKLNNLSCGFDFKGPLVCCKNVNSIDENGKESPDNKNAIDNTNKVTKGNKTVTNTRHGGNIRGHPNFRLLPEDCGISKGDRISGGDVTGLYEMPWMVLLSYEHVDLGPYYGCGGTLINEWYVLTAAHCIDLLSTKLKLNGVILGEHDTRTDPDCLEPNNCAPPIRNVTIDESIVHPKYKNTEYLYDIALIRLSEPADFSLSSMKPVCLATTKELQLEESVQKDGEAAGWGITEDRITSSILLSVIVPIIPLDRCNVMYKGLLELKESQMCAGGVKGEDSCSGDSGGPLLYVSQNGKKQRYYQQGIVSYGSQDCAIGGYPTLYTRVSYYIDWILDNMHS